MSLRPDVGTANWNIAATLALLVCLLMVGCDRPDAQNGVSSKEHSAPSTMDPVLEEVSEPVTLSGAGNLTRLAALEQLHEALRTAPPDVQNAAACATEFARDGNLTALRQLTAPQVASLADHLADRMSLQDLGGTIETLFRLPARVYSSREEAVNAVVEVVEVLAGNADSNGASSALVITDACDPDGRVTGSTHVIPAGARRVHAVFENGRILAGRREVYAVWRSLTNDRLVFAETEPVRPGAHYNFVWLELADGWPGGHYEVALHDSASPSHLLAVETFTVR